MRSSFANGLFWTSVACCTIAQFFIIRSVLGSRHAPEPVANVPKSRDAVEVMWAIVPAVVLAVLLFFTWRAMRIPA
jgi:heme/copper-type cytochrome/quinol oxidase subunit 2